MKRSEQAMCGDKVRHATRGAASAAILAMVRDLGTRPGLMVPYRCPHCTSWHVGHRRRR